MRRPIPFGAAGMVAGALLATRLAVLPLPLLVALLALGLALATRCGRALAGVSGGALLAVAAGAHGAAAVADDGWLHPERPVEMVARTIGHARAERSGRDELVVRARSVRARQGRSIDVSRRELWLVLPADVARPAPGTALRLRGWLRRAAGARNGVPRRPGAWRLRVSSRRLVAVERPPSDAAIALAGARARLEHAFDAAGARGQVHAAALARTLVLGDARDLPEAWRIGLRRAGLAHLTAVSGLHVGLVGALALVLAAAAPRPLRLVLGALAVTVYLGLVGPRPSALRAAGMALLLLSALGLRRPPQPLSALALVTAAAVAARPPLIDDLGFRLSVGATAAILVLAPALAARWPRLPPTLRGSLAVTVAAQIGTMPIAVPAFALAAPAAPLLNLVAVPWLTLTLAAALGWSVLAAFPSGVGDALAAAPRLALELLARPLDLLAAAPASPWLTLPVAPRPATGLALAALLLLAATSSPRALARRSLVLLVLIQTPARPPPLAELWLLDVGQGDAILLRHGRGAVLVDGGGWPRGDIAAKVLLPALAGIGVRRLDAVALTHPDVDHCRGLVQLVRYLPVAELWAAPGWPAPSCGGALRTLAGRRWRGLTAGTRLAVGGWRLEVLHPAAGKSAGASRGGSDNDRSLVLLARAAGHRVLLTGDIETRAERAMLSRWGEGLRADVLKVAHHGSRSSSGARFLDAVAPRLALVSAGRGNPYGHPAPEVLARLARRGVPVLRTDRGGAVRLRFTATGPIAIARPDRGRWPRGSVCQSEAPGGARKRSRARVDHARLCLRLCEFGRAPAWLRALRISADAASDGKATHDRAAVHGGSKPIE